MFSLLSTIALANSQPVLGPPPPPVERPAASADLFSVSENPLQLGSRAQVDEATRRSRRVAKTGLVVASVGLPVALAGTSYAAFTGILAGPAEAKGGVTVMYAGMSMMGIGSIALLGGTMRSASVLRNHGLNANRAYAWVGWGLFGSSLAVGLVSNPVVRPLLTAPLLCSAVIMGGVQSLHNRKVRRSAPDVAWTDRRPDVSVVPWVAPDGGEGSSQGLAVMGSF